MEIWKNVVNYEGLYEISNLSRVRSLDRVIETKKGSRVFKGKLLKGVIEKRTNYTLYSFSKNGLVSNARVHIVMAIAFLNHTPCKYELVVDHIDENPLNNSLNNLQIVTHRKNIGKSKLLRSKNKYTGICFHTRHKKWMANIYIKSKSTHIGYFDSEQEALAERNKYIQIHNL